MLLSPSFATSVDSTVGGVLGSREFDSHSRRKRYCFRFNFFNETFRCGSVSAFIIIYCLIEWADTMNAFYPLSIFDTPVSGRKEKKSKVRSAMPCSDTRLRSIIYSFCSYSFSVGSIIHCVISLVWTSRHRHMCMPHWFVGFYWSLMATRQSVSTVHTKKQKDCIELSMKFGGFSELCKISRPKVDAVFGANDWNSNRNTI